MNPVTLIAAYCGAFTKIIDLHPSSADIIKSDITINNAPNHHEDYFSLRKLRIEQKYQHTMADGFASSQMVVSRQNGTNNQLATTNGTNGTLIQSQPRTSGLQAPVMELSGHSGEVFAARFNPEGNYIASGSMDRTISTCS